MLFNSFLFAVIDIEDEINLFKLKEKFLTTDEAIILTDVKDFFAKYKKFPDINTLEQKHTIKIPFNSEPPKYWYDELYKKYRERLMEDAIVSAARNKKGAAAIFQQAIIDYNVDDEVQVHNYSEGKRRITDYQERQKTKGITYLSTNMDELDLFSMGLTRTDLWTIAGAEGAGKTWFLLRMAHNIDQYMLNNGISRPILIISGEMEAGELEIRLDSISCGISYGRLLSGTLNAAEEITFNTFISNFESNIVIVDTFESIQDIEYFQQLYRPAVIMIDGSHLLSGTYEWQDISQVTKGMKSMARNKKVPIINTTHLKSDKGNTAEGGSKDDVAYTKGYSRDSDILGIMFSSDLMQVDDQFGIDWVKVRRGDKARTTYRNIKEESKMVLVEHLIGAQLAQAKINAQNPPPATRGTQQNAKGGAQNTGGTAQKGTYTQKKTQIY